jgi:hypothetical protein
MSRTNAIFFYSFFILVFLAFLWGGALRASLKLCSFCYTAKRTENWCALRTSQSLKAVPHCSRGALRKLEA